MSRLIFLIPYCLIFAGGSVSVFAATEELTVFAAAGVAPVLESINTAYQDETNVKVCLNVASSSRLAKQIEAGASCDLFISANAKWVDYLDVKGLVDLSTCRLAATTSLVLISSGVSMSPKVLLAETDFVTLLDQKIAMGDPAHVPVGMYTEQALRHLGWWSQLKSCFVPAANVADVLRFVETGQCDTGIVYASMAHLSKKVSVQGTFSADSHDRIQFVAVCPTDQKAGIKFLDYLSSSRSQERFRQYGFHVSPSTQTEIPAKVQPVVSPGPVLPAVWLSLKVALVCMLIVVVPGTLLGWILARKNFYGKALLEAIVLLPLVIPPVVTGYLALIVLGKNGLLGRHLFDAFGMSIPFTSFAVVITSAIMGMPLLIRSVKTAVHMIDPRLELAASTLGKSPVKVFFSVTLPLALPGILSGLSLAFARSLGEFGATATFAGNIPGKTRTLSLAIHSLTQIPNGDAAALKLTVFAVGISILTLYASEKLVQRSIHRVN